MAMRLIPDMGVFQKKLATLPLATYQAGETALSATSRTGRLLILKEGAVIVVKEGVEIASVVEPGAVFGELSVLLKSAAHGGRACGDSVAVLRRRCRYSTHERPNRAPLRCDGPGAASGQRQSESPRAEAPGSSRRVARRNWENGREDRRIAGRNWCQSYVCRLSYGPVRLTHRQLNGKTPDRLLSVASDRPTVTVCTSNGRRYCHGRSDDLAARRQRLSRSGHAGIE